MPCNTRRMVSYLRRKGYKVKKIKGGYYFVKPMRKNKYGQSYD